MGWKHWADYFRRDFPVHAMLAFFFSIPLSTTAVEITGSAFLVSWLFSGKLLGGQWGRSWNTIPFILLMLLPLAGYFHAPDPAVALPLVANARFWLFTLALAAMEFGQRLTPAAMKAFLTGLTLTCLVATGQFVLRGPLKEGVSRFGFFHPHMHGTISLFLAFGLLIVSRIYKDSRSPNTRKACILLAVFLLFSTLVIIPGRIGYVALLLGLPAIVCNFLGLRFRLRAILVYGVILFLAVVSPTVQSRIGQAFDDMSRYQSGKVDSSLGARVEMWKFSVRLMQENVLFGNGPGAFRVRWAKEKPPGIAQNYVEPHNILCHIGAEFGLVGLALLGWALFALVRCTRAATGTFQGFTAGAFLLVFLVGSITNSMITGVTNSIWTAALCGLALKLPPFVGARRRTGEDVAPSDPAIA